MEALLRKESGRVSVDGESLGGGRGVVGVGGFDEGVRGVEGDAELIGASGEADG
jgi:hypothetical protein